MNNITRLRPKLIILISLFYYFIAYYMNTSFAISSSLRRHILVTPEATCSQVLQDNKIHIIAKEMTLLYLELFHKRDFSYHGNKARTEISHQSLWNDKLAEVEIEFPGISQIIKDYINRILPNYLRIRTTHERYLYNQFAHDKFTFNKYETNEADKMWNICRRTPQIQKAITLQIGIPCEQIKGEDLHKIRRLDLPNENISSLLEFDFWGLANLEELYLDGNQIHRLHEKQFHGLTQLKWLSFAGNRLKSFHEKQFEDLINIHVIDFKHNQIINIHEKQFQGLNFLYGLYLQGNQLKNIKQFQFNGLTNIEQIYLQGNPLTSQTKEALKHYFDKNQVDLQL